MTLAEARAEVMARGFDYLASTRINSYLNRSLASISSEASWPWLETSLTGVAPLAISIPTGAVDVRAVQSCVDTTTKTVLAPIDRRTLVDLHPDLTVTGTPVYWYREGVDYLSVYPANTTDVLNVRVVIYEPSLTVDATSPLLPVRHHNVWIDRAVYEAYVDSDNFDAAAILKNKVDNEVVEMRRAYMQPNLDQPYSISSTRLHEGF
jgi:hypothetical protein